MRRGSERIQRIVATLQDENLDALVCALPSNVLLLSGYWPVVGTALAVATRDAGTAVLAPSDEQELALHGWAEVRTYSPGSLSHLTSPAEAVVSPLRELVRDLGIGSGRIGLEERSIYEESSYAAMYLYQASIRHLLGDVAPGAKPTSGDAAISGLRTSLVPDEVEQVRLGCQIAGEAFASVAGGLRPGLREAEVATALETPMVIQGLAHPRVERTGAFTFCMSGANSALAGGAYARTRERELRAGDFALVHCNSYVDGYWTDITRTYCLGDPDERQLAMYDAVFEARGAALRTIRPGVGVAEVDRAARDVLGERGFGEYFTHGIGHNVGFSAISPDFPPRLHPASPDHLAVGMTFNIEPAIYIEGYGGLRHCDVVTVHEDGPEILTPFQAGLEHLTVQG